MNKSTFLLLENYMLSCMEDGDSAHDSRTRKLEEIIEEES